MSRDDRLDEPPGEEQREAPPRPLAVLKAYLAIMRPYLISVVGLGLAYGCWLADNWPGTVFFLAVAFLPLALRQVFRAMAWLRRDRGS